jgi:DNA-directed RNA polymerase specialized sigma24 family protein
VWKALETGERIADLSASYVYRAAASAAVDLMRRRQARRDDLATPLERADPSALAEPVLDRLDLADLGATIEDAIGDLVPTRRPVVRMYLEGYAAAEIAGLMGWTEGKARNLLSRGLAELRAALRRRGVGPEGVE